MTTTKVVGSRGVIVHEFVSTNSKTRRIDLPISIIWRTREHGDPEDSNPQPAD